VKGRLYLHNLPSRGGAGSEQVHGSVVQAAHQDAIFFWVDPLYSTGMPTQLIIDKAGRIVIPKTLRDELHLEAGDALELQSAGEEITLRPVRGTGPLAKEHGVWVFRSGEPIPASVTDALLQQIRSDRDAANRGANE
jgi:AbrB family looped-hinge helix DNA binding protein